MKQPEPAPLRPMTLGSDGAVQLDINDPPQPLTTLQVNGVDIDPHQVIAPMTVQRDEAGRVIVAFRWIVDDVQLTTADGKTWRLSADGDLTAVGPTEKENG